MRFLGSVPVRACSLPQYDYFLVLVNNYFQYDYVLYVNDYFPKAVRGTSLQ
jgi:hypothetical protein